MSLAFAVTWTMSLTVALACGAVIETVGGLLIMIGLHAALVAFICSGEMAYAYFTMHQPKATWPIFNGGELAALFAFIFLFVATRGAGPLSVSGGK